MKLFRNPEIKRYLFLYAILLAAVLLAAYFVGRKGMLPAACAVIFCAVLHWREAAGRYKMLEDMANELDSSLHSGKRLELSRFQEGELSLLSNEIGKMAVRLEEQASQLQADKQYLVDSIADISHQIRTPLTAIRLHMEALKQPELSEEDQNRHIREIRLLQDRIDWLIDALLKMAKLDAGTIVMKRESIAMRELLQKAVEPLEILMELKGQGLFLDAQGRIEADLSWTKEAVGNILKNCVEHMGQGTIYLTARENPVYSEIIIRDTGEGIKKEDLPHLFERFYKGENAAEQNVGIGLALSRTIIGSQGGTVRAQNHPDGGAMFVIRFYKGERGR